MERLSGEEKEKKKKTGKKSAAAAAAPEPERSKDGIVEWRQMPHMLTMTATPIPRTLAMCEHGEMAISCIDEKPAGRLPIFTKILMSKDHHIAYDKYMVDAVKSGSQCYIILPLVEESKAERMERFKSAEEEHKRLVEKYPEVTFGILHGKQSSDEKATALKDFKDGKTQVLVATTVIEVGVDVANASLIIIEDADRFGVAQLHQMRGRVGRGKTASSCFLLLGDEAGYPAQQRMKVLEQSNNGFKVAESDLRNRGPGDLTGTRQSGHKDTLCLARVETDLALVEAARRAAAETIARANVRGESLPAPLAVRIMDRPPALDLNA